MSQWVDFDYVKQQVGIADVLRHYGLLEAMVDKKNGELKGHCPFHDDTQPSFGANTDTNVFNCFGGSCKVHGDVIDFVQLQEGIDTGDRNQGRRRAALLLQDWFQLTSPRTARKGTATSADVVVEVTEKEESPAEPEHEGGGEPAGEEKENRVNAPLQFSLQNLDQTHSYLSERELTPETIETFGVGYHSGKGLMSGRVAVPIHNTNGELVAYAGRFPGEPPEGEGKYILPPKFRKSLELFNLHRAHYRLGKAGLIVVEGFFDCMSVWQHGWQSVVALMGSTMSDEQERLIVQVAGGGEGKVTLLFDEDEAGRACRDDARKRLSNVLYVKVPELGEEGKQPDHLSRSELVSVLS